MLRTKAQEDTLCKTCPLAKTANLVGDSCVLLIIRDLLSGPKRFSNLEASLTGISTRTLTNKLKMLEEKDIVKKVTTKGRTGHDSAESKKGAPHTEYTLTKKGLGLNDITIAMRAYGKKYL
jgi:DNA-binding HxlR family transcriptional regulator